MDVDPGEFELALAQLPRRLREAAGLFRELTGFTMVSSFRGPATDDRSPGGISPPMHPLCAARLGRSRRVLPCEDQWQKHLRSSARDRAVQRHVCPLGLHCSCVPIYYGGALAGVAKCVVGPGAGTRRFPHAIRLLEFTIAHACQEFRVSLLYERTRALQEQVAQLLEIRRGAGPAGDGGGPRQPVDGAPLPSEAGRSLAEQALGYIGRNYLDANLSLAVISRALKINGKYLTLLFSQFVGQHMRTYILQLRVQHACRLILSTDKPVKQVALESGFSRVDVFRRTFHRYVGVAPGAYRRAFSHV